MWYLIQVSRATAIDYRPGWFKHKNLKCQDRYYSLNNLLKYFLIIIFIFESFIKANSVFRWTRHHRLVLRIWRLRTRFRQRRSVAKNEISMVNENHFINGEIFSFKGDVSWRSDRTRIRNWSWVLQHITISVTVQ